MKKTEHQIDGERAEEQSKEEKKKTKTDAERARARGWTERERKKVYAKSISWPQGQQTAVAMATRYPQPTLPDARAHTRAAVEGCDVRKAKGWCFIVTIMKTFSTKISQRSRKWGHNKTHEGRKLKEFTVHSEMMRKRIPVCNIMCTSASSDYACWIYAGLCWEVEQLVQVLCLVLSRQCASGWSECCVRTDTAKSKSNRNRSRSEAGWETWTSCSDGQRSPWVTPFTSSVILNTLISIETTPVDKHSTFSKSFNEHRLCTFSDAVQPSATGTGLFSQKIRFQVWKDKFCVQFSIRSLIFDLFRAAESFASLCSLRGKRDSSPTAWRPLWWCTACHQSRPVSHLTPTTRSDESSPKKK